MVINLVLNKQAKAQNPTKRAGDYVIEGNSILISILHWSLDAFAM
jgi:hypothetical protein